MYACPNETNENIKYTLWLFDDFSPLKYGFSQAEFPLLMLLISMLRVMQHIIALTIPYITS